MDTQLHTPRPSATIPDPPLLYAPSEQRTPVPIPPPRSELLPPERPRAVTLRRDEDPAAAAGPLAPPRPPSLRFPADTTDPAPAPPRATPPRPEPARATTQAPAARPRIEIADHSELRFPLDHRPPSWHVAPRSFGSRRDGGRRKHAGCDLYADVGTPIYAIADGTLVRPAYHFYQHVDAVEIRHGGLIVRYGEIMAGSYVGGKTVRKGQMICKVGKLVKLPSMLHLEMYSNAASSAPLTVRGRAPYQRRADLIDPTPLLDAWARALAG